ncbi:hypothetical protein FSP39_017713 [Pinctada imbricata]|uniref:Cystatin domain-containing protein n=1 Tax=Pinctada imbricata TaxID=66713 RepID=A0AA88XX01_PINIB|nr:hypothetical protein FSP39_017713 [Pinctada imbricata]
MKSLRLLSLTCALVLALLGTSTAQPRTGAFDEEKAATEDISKLVKNVKGDIKKALACTNVAYSEPLTALKFRQQVVAGMNYIVSHKIDNSENQKPRAYKIRIKQKPNKQKPPPHEKKRTPDMRVRPGAQEKQASPARKFYGRYGELEIYYDVPLSRMMDDIL